MAFKFDGTKLVDGSKVLANVRGDKIYEGSGPFKALANVRGDKIYEGSGPFKTLTNMKEAAKKLGSTSQGPLTAALWYLFCR